ncbi:DUF421 domain-containing protein [Pararhodobacter marinus]|uniref:DUF421 domain-containing protein n=1 Tax=Pararhodobacter marinus TaxID=2184063 RepID=UPI003513CA8E
MDLVLEPFVRAAAAVAAVIFLTRLNGLRSFSKMSSFDFALTIATGSVLGSTISDTSSAFVSGIAAITAIFAVQALVAFGRSRARRIERTVDNEPLLLMDGRLFLHANLAHARLTEDDLRARLRETGVSSLDAVRAAVLETTGTISILTRPDTGQDDSDLLLAGVRRSV